MPRAHLRFKDTYPRLVQARPQLAGRPVGGMFGVCLSRNLFVERGEFVIRGEDPGVVLGEPVLLYKACLLLLGQLGEAALYLSNPGRGELQGQKVGLGEVTIVVSVLLAPELVNLVGLGVVMHSRLLDVASALQDLLLALELAREASLDEAEGVHVLELGLGAEGAIGVANAHVGVAAELALLHVGLRDPDSLENGLEVVRRGAGGLWRGDVGFGDDLDEGSAAPVKVHERADRAVHPARLTDVHVLGRVLLEVQARDLDPDGALRGRDVEMSTDADRGIVLGDLVPLRQVGVEVVFSREDGPRRNLAVQREPRHHPELDRLLVDDRQGTRMPETDRAGMGVRLVAVDDPAGAEHLRPGSEMNVKLEPDDRLVSPSLLCLQWPSSRLPRLLFSSLF